MITKIYHISDVHARTYKRHKEYQNVFNRVFKYIEETKDENSVIFLGGDIVHSKTDMSPELVDLVSKFLKRCADTLPTILILGNHDLNLNNVNRLDALSPIVSSLNHPNLHFWRESGVYKLHGVSFSVFSVIDSVDKWVLSENVKGKYKIALHHGAVHNANTDLNYRIKNEHVTLSKFSGFDLGLLGDIHQFQFLNDEKTIAYSSSLIQQNYGESLQNHGMIIWDLKTKKGQFVEIENDFGYYTFEFENGVCVNELERYPKHLRARVKYENTNKEQISMFFKKLGKKCEVTEIIYHKKDITNRMSSDSALVLKDMRDVENQNQLITEYIVESLKVTDEKILDSVRHLNRVANSTLNSNQLIIRGVTWRPKRFEFSNMFSYGEDNVIDFTNFSGVYGLFAANASGKSAALDAFCFCLFDKTPRASKASHILNIKKKDFRCKLIFELNGLDYEIERIGISNDKGNVRVNVNFSFINEYGERISLNGEERDSTNKNIRDYIGTYDDFVMTVLSSQIDNQSFVDKSQRERKDLLYKFLDIAIFDDLQKVAKENYKEILYKIKDLEKSDIRKELFSSETNLKLYKERLQFLHSEIETEKAAIKQLVTNVSEIAKKVTPIDAKLNLDVIETNKQKCETELLECVETLKIVNERIALLTDEISKIQEDPTVVERHSNLRNEIEQLKTKISQLQKDEALLRKELEMCDTKIQHLATHEYDPNCQFCIKNPFVVDAKNAEYQFGIFEIQLQKLLDEKNELNVLLRKTMDEFYIVEQYLEKQETRNKLGFQLSMEQEKRTSLQYKGKMFREKYDAILKDEREYHSQEEIIKRNIELEKELRILNSEIKDRQSNETSRQAEYRKVYSNIQLESSKIKKFNEDLDIHADLSRRAHDYELYLQAISKEGVPYKILSLVLPVLEFEINNILSQLVDFSIKLEATDEKNVVAFIVYSEDKFWPVEMTSGMERFILSQAIRSALVNITNLPKSNFIAIDEGFGVLDPDNLNSVYLLFEHLKQKTDFVLCISHIESMKDTVDKVITIDKVGDFSRIMVV